MVEGAMIAPLPKFADGEDISCHNAFDGSANVVMHADSNGTGALTFLWTSTSVIGGGQGTNSIVGLDSGLYVVSLARIPF